MPVEIKHILFSRILRYLNLASEFLVTRVFNMDCKKIDKADRPVCSRVSSAVKETELQNRHWFLVMGQFNPVHTHILLL